MFNFWSIIQSIFLPLFLLVGVAGSSIGLAEDDLEVGKKSKELVDEMKQKESEMRAQTEKKIAWKRERALEDLEKMRRFYKSLDKETEEESIEIEIKLLRKKMTTPAEGRQVAPEIRPDGGDRERRPDRENKPDRSDSKNKFFKYRTSYIFDEKGIISGKFIFMPTQKVRIIYNYKGKDASAFLDWKDMGDHVQVNGDSTLGTIIISESPSSNLKSLLIRWGGELTNKLTDGHSE